jgi:magnesium-transporting ATPase (P-type)
VKKLEKKYFNVDEDGNDYPFKTTKYERYMDSNDFKDENGWFPMNEFTFIGFISTFDPPNHSASLALMEIKEKNPNIRLILMTGDKVESTL